MQKLAKLLAIAFLLFNGIGALFGGFQLMIDPSGGKLQIPLSYLQYSPFRDYLIPGVVLFCVNGLFSMLVLGALALQHRHAHLLVMAQGLLLGGWILAQILMLRVFYPPLHGLFLAVGAVLLVCGWAMRPR